jgi:hypothetical protein
VEEKSRALGRRPDDTHVGPTGPTCCPLGLRFTLVFSGVF